MGPLRQKVLELSFSIDIGVPAPGYPGVSLLPRLGQLVPQYRCLGGGDGLALRLARLLLPRRPRTPSASGSSTSCSICREGCSTASGSPAPSGLAISSTRRRRASPTRRPGPSSSATAGCGSARPSSRFPWHDPRRGDRGRVLGDSGCDGRRYGERHHQHVRQPLRPSSSLRPVSPLGTPST